MADLMVGINNYASPTPKKKEKDIMLKANMRMKKMGYTQERRAEVLGLSSKTIYRFDKEKKAFDGQIDNNIESTV